MSLCVHLYVYRFNVCLHCINYKSRIVLQPEALNICCISMMKWVHTLTDNHTHNAQTHKRDEQQMNITSFKIFRGITSSFCLSFIVHHGHKMLVNWFEWTLDNEIIRKTSYLVNWRNGIQYYIYNNNWSAQYSSSYISLTNPTICAFFICLNVMNNGRNAEVKLHWS